MTKGDLAVRVRGLSKSYAIVQGVEKHSTLAETVISRLKNPLQRPDIKTFWAVNDVNFDVRKGDVVGIIGRNGAGKSTLLKILSRITEPTHGEIDLFGRVGSLLEVGTGFHPELTGRENIFLNGAILGMNKAEIRKQFDAIVEFAGVEQFLDTAVKRYSSGMYVRLAFAVAAHLESEILVVDEVLAVGDAEFQRKCLGKMKDVATSGRTVFLVSHQMHTIRTLCDQGLYFDNGVCRGSEPIEQCIERYVNSFTLPLIAAGDPLRRPGTGEHRFTSVSRSKEAFECGEPKVIRFAIRRYKPFDGKLHISALLHDETGNIVLHLDSRMVGYSMNSQELSNGELIITTPWLRPGQYRLDLFICSNGIQDRFEGACQLDVLPLLPYLSAYANAEATAHGIVFADYAFRNK